MIQETRIAGNDNSKQATFIIRQYNVDLKCVVHPTKGQIYAVVNRISVNEIRSALYTIRILATDAVFNDTWSLSAGIFRP